MDLSFVPLDRNAIEPIADLLSVNFGLGKLILENCNLVDETLKPLLHALLISGSLPTLSLASNRKIKFNGWRYVAIFIKRAKALRYLDLSENNINKAALEQLVQAIARNEKSFESNKGESAGSREGGDGQSSATSATSRITSMKEPERKSELESESGPKQNAASKSNGKVRRMDQDLGMSASTLEETAQETNLKSPSSSTSALASTLSGPSTSEPISSKGNDLDIPDPNTTSTTSSTLNSALEPEEHYDDFDNLALMPCAPLLRSIPVSETTPPPSSAIISLRLENCGLKTNSLEILAAGVRTSDLRHLSLRRNRIGQMGAVALAGMLKDYPDSRSNASYRAEELLKGNEAAESVENGPGSLNQGSSSGRIRTPSSASFPDMSRSATLPADDSHRRTLPYSAPATRTRYNTTDDYSNSNIQSSSSPTIPDLPVVTSSPAGGITSRRLASSSFTSLSQNSNLRAMNADANANMFAHGQQSSTNSVAFDSSLSPLQELDRQLTHSEKERIRAQAPSAMSEEEAISAYQAKRTKRILKDLPRIGNLLTLDLKSNDIRNGVIYISQVLKKNRTLRVLNLSDNNIEINGLCHLAEALKINSTLETLDISHNPCAGPGLDGITRLRTAFTLNSNLKRLFLNDTDLSSEGAIALAEFLPEAKSLIHLDLTENFAIDIAGVMALAVSVKMNQSLRCLDLNIPANDPDFARLSQDILQSCVRNTEAAQRKALQRGSKQAIAAPIYKSVVARAAKEKDERTRAVKAAKAAEESEHRARSEGRAQDAKELVKEAEECLNVLSDLVGGEEERRKEKLKESQEKIKENGTSGRLSEEPGKPDFVDDLVTQAKRLRERLVKAVGGMQEGEILDRALTLNDSLESVSSRLSNLYLSTPTIDTTSLEAATNQPIEGVHPVQLENLDLQSPGHLSTPVIESSLSSPTFSIGSEEDEDDDEEDPGNVSRDPQDQVGLGILPASTSDSIEIQAAREELPLAEQTDAEKEETENESKAKGQLSEEGELFRKAKSLGLDEEDEEDESVSQISDQKAQSSSSTVSQSLHVGTNDTDDNPQIKTSNLDDKSNSKTLHSPNSSISGEELRKDLLQAEIPLSSSSPSSSPSSSSSSSVPKDDN